MDISKYKKALILGGGLSGLGAAQLLAKNGVAVRVSEGKKIIPRYRDIFLSVGSEIFENGHNINHLDHCDVVVCSPGIPQSHPLIQLAKKNTIPIFSEIDLALSLYSGLTIAVTGTNGKSTICAVIAHSLKKMGYHAAAGGNFGDPPSKMIAENRAPDYLVLELSSYQLEISKLISPKVAIFSNFSLDHLGRHGTLDAYFRAKWSIFSTLSPQSMGFVTQDILEQSRQYELEQNNKIVTIDPMHSKFKDYAPKTLNSPVNTHNFCFAASAIEFLTKKSPNDIKSSLDDFEGLPYRCQNIGTLSGFNIANDSKSTNVDSTLAALSGYRDPVILFMGGQGKGEPYSPILTLRHNIMALVTFGASGQTIHEELSIIASRYNFRDLKDAVHELPKLLSRYQCPVLFSPGCASFDEFDNYEHRGQFFTDQLALMKE